MYRFLAEILLIIILISNCTSVVDAEIVQGFITKIDSVNNKISIDNNTYNISKDCFIKLNNNSVTLNGLKSPYPNFYKWTIVNLNNNIVTNIESYYKVVEGKVSEISLSEGWVIVSEFQQDSDCKNLIKKYYFNPEFNNKLKSYKKQEYIVLVTALDKLLYLP